MKTPLPQVRQWGLKVFWIALKPDCRPASKQGQEQFQPAI